MLTVNSDLERSYQIFSEGKENKLEKTRKLISGSVWPHVGHKTVPEENHSLSAPSSNIWDFPKIYFEKN